MPKPRRSATVLPNNRAVVWRLPGCPCGCTSEVCINLTADEDGMVDRPNYSEAERLAYARHVRPGAIREALSEGFIAQSIIDDLEERMAGTDKEVGALIKLAEEQGFTVEQEGSSIRWTNPEGGSVSTPTRVIGRGLQNIKAQLRRLGLDIPRTGKGTPRVEDAIEQALEMGATTGVVDLTDASLKHRAEVPNIPAEVTAAYAALATLTEFVQVHQQTDESGEWQSICEGLEADLAEARAERDQAIKERDALQGKVDTLKSLFQ